MRRAAAILAATCSIGLGGTTTLGAISASAHTPVAALAQTASCVYGKIGGVRKCLRAGEYCARRYQRQYRRYGFTCSKRDDRGDWHLERT